jgi:hypothetical protein
MINNVTATVNAKAKQWTHLWASLIQVTLRYHLLHIYFNVILPSPSLILKVVDFQDFSLSKFCIYFLFPHPRNMINLLHPPLYEYPDKMTGLYKFQISLCNIFHSSVNFIALTFMYLVEHFVFQLLQFVQCKKEDFISNCCVNTTAINAPTV